jgi:cleavage stimulation factor subunit 3
MAELYPDDPKLSRFAARFSGEGFEPTAVRLIISPSTQLRPKAIGTGVMQSIEQPTPMQNSPRPNYVQENSPRPQYLPGTNSPKRPFPLEDENDLNRPRKLARGESPLKGAAGRRLDQQKRLQQGGTPTWQSNAPPFVVPRDITFLLSIIPRAETYTGARYRPEALVKLLRETIVPDYNTWRTARDQSQPPPVQRYDGRRPRTVQHPPSNEYTAPPAPSGYQAYPSQPEAWSDGHYSQIPYVGQPTVHGLPPRPGPLPAPVRSGYLGPGQDESAGRQEAPELLPAASWYYRG